MSKEEFLKKARDIHGYKYQYLNLSDKVLSTDIIDIMYNEVLYKQRVVKHITLKRCPEKNTNIKTTNQFILECKERWGDKYDYSLTEYKGALKKVKIIYQGQIFEQVASLHLNGAQPEFRNKTTENFIRKSKLVHGDKYDYRYVNFKSSQQVVQIGYNDVFYLQTPENHLSGNCPENRCLSERKSTIVFIKESNLVHDFKYSYVKTDYIKNQIKVIITCPIHGDFNQRPLSHLQGMGCPSCNDSKGEREIAKFLDKYGIVYDRQKKFIGCRNVFELPFDFYIPSMRICIEFDGRQHYEPIGYFGGVSTFEKLKVNDKIKNDYCEDNYINLIRIKYDQENIIWEILWDNLKSFIKSVS